MSARLWRQAWHYCKRATFPRAKANFYGRPNPLSHVSASKKTAILPITFGLLGISYGSKKKPQNEEPQESPEQQRLLNLKDALAEADRLYAENNESAAYDLLLRTSQEMGPSQEVGVSDEIHWRLARAACEMAKNLPEGDPKRKELMYEGLKHTEQALKVNENNFACHKWAGIMINYTADFEGTKAKISKSFIVKEHFLKAIELNPKDSTTMHCLGVWCFSVAELPWYTKKMAAVIFATPPSSTYEEALKYLEMAENTDPGFFSMNWVLLSKTYSRLGQKEKAIEFMTKARDNPLKSADDKAANEKALELLPKLQNGKTI